MLAHLSGYYALKKLGKNPEFTHSVVLYTAIGALIGGRLVHVFLYGPQFYLQHPEEIIKVWKGGLSSHGDALGVIAAIFLLNKRFPEHSKIFLSDLLCFALPCVYGLVRLGNFFNHEMIGTPTDVYWAIITPSYDMVARHPAALYEFVSSGLVFLVVFKYFSVRAFSRPGLLSGVTLILIGLFRIVIECFKLPQSPTDVAIVSHLGINMGQLFTIPFIIIGVILLIKSR